MGKIYQRGNTWYSNYSFRGKRLRTPLSANKRVAQAMQEELISANRFRRNGLIPLSLSLSVFETQYLKISQAENAYNTFAHDKLAFRRLHDLYALQHIHEITPELLRDAQIKWKDRGYGPVAIGSYVMRLKVAMKTAETWKYVQPQAWNTVKDYVSPGRMIYYTVEQFQKMLAKTSGYWTTALLLMCRAGLRSGEARYLEPSDLLFKERLIHIHAKPHWKPKGWKPNKPKERFINMPPDLEAHLKSLPRGQRFVLGSELISSGTYSRYFSDLVLGCGLRGSAHAFRHTYASWLISNGATLEEVGELMGHDDPKTTKIYSHMLPHALKKAVSRLPPLVAVLWHSFPPKVVLKGMKKHETAV